MVQSDWERCRPWIEAALPYAGGTHTIQDIEIELRRGHLALMAGQKSAMLCEVRNYPRLCALHIFLAGGDLKELKSFNAMMDNAARNLGCSRISIAGRHGWERALNDLGYKKRWTVLSKEIGHE
jgi:hypothetical protein